MPADPIMLQEAKEEGVMFRFLVGAKSYEGPNGHVITTTMNSMKLGAPDQTGRSPEPVPGKEFKIDCSSVLLAVGRGPNSFLQKKAGIKRGKKNSIATGGGREAAQRVHEYPMNLEENHMSFYESYYIDNSYDRMMEDNDKPGPPPQ